MSSLKQKTVSGVLWTGLAKMSMQLMLLVVMFVLARLLSEDDFGIVAMASVITIAIGMVNDRGLGTAIIQKKQLTDTILSSMFWGSAGFGLILFLAGAAISYPLSWFYREPVVVPVVQTLSLGFLIGSLGIVQKSLLTREMAFRKLAVIEIAAVSVSGVAAIILALLNTGVWSLVCLTLLRDVITIVLVWILYKWRPRFHFSWTEFKKMLGFSANVLGNDMALYLVTNTDITIIGRVLGKAMLGYYSLALNLVKLPVTRISGIVSRVVFPAFSELQDDLPRFKKSFLRSITFISLITFPMLAGLAVFAREFIVVVLGDKWLPMTLPLIILTPMAMLKSVGSIKGSVLMACGRPDIELKWNLFYFPLLIAVVWLGTRYGLNGAALAFTLFYILTFPVIQQITNRQIGLTLTDFGRSLTVSTFSTAIMVFAGIIYKLFAINVLHAGELLVLITGILISVMVYLLSVKIIRKSLLTELINMFIKSRQKTPDMTEAAVNL